MGNKYEVSEWYEDKTDGRGLAYCYVISGEKK